MKKIVSSKLVEAVCEINGVDRLDFDKQVESMSKDQIMRNVLQWELGDPGWWDQINTWQKQAEEIAGQNREG